MRSLLAIIVLALLAMPVLAIDEDSPNLNLYHATKLYGAERLPASWDAFHLLFHPEVEADVYWTSFGGFAVIGISHIVFADSEQEDEYFEDMELYFDTVFENYAPYQLRATCGREELVLHEFMAGDAGAEYLIKHYLEDTGRHETRIISLYFPLDLWTEMNETAALFYPDLPSCPED